MFSSLSLNGIVATGGHCTVHDNLHKTTGKIMMMTTGKEYAYRNEYEYNIT